MKTELLLVVEKPKYSYFSRKNGRTGQQIRFVDSDYYTHDIECVDKEDFDLSGYDGVKEVSFICALRNQKATIDYKDKKQDRYIPTIKITGAKPS